MSEFRKSMSGIVTPKVAASMLGVHHVTLRRWSLAGKIPSERLPSGHRRYRISDIQAHLNGKNPLPIRVAIYVRVSGRGDQLTSLKHQESQLRAIDNELVYRVYQDIGSGLNENRRGLQLMLKDIRERRVNRVRVTHQDRLTRFGYDFLRQYCAAYQCEIEILHQDQEKETEETELMKDFMSLIASFSGRLYGQRSRKTRQRLLKQASNQVGSGDD
jgi:predicted site-specific integrase-resolvase